MEHEQRVIIKFLFNDGLDPRQIVEKLEAQFHEDVYSLRAVQFWIGEGRRSREDLPDDPRLEGRPKGISQPKFRNYEMNIHLNQCARSLKLRTSSIQLY
jgi:transposase